jgi:hypothetical protein
MMDADADGGRLDRPPTPDHAAQEGGLSLRVGEPLASRDAHGSENTRQHSRLMRHVARHRDEVLQGQAPDFPARTPYVLQGARKQAIGRQDGARAGQQYVLPEGDARFGLGHDWRTWKNQAPSQARPDRPTAPRWFASRQPPGERRHEHEEGEPEGE